MLQTYTLRNGIPVIVAESHASKVVSIQAWISRGSVHEPSRLAGISHFIEHALFKGTKKRRVGEIASDIEARGGEINAYTSFEETVYYTTLASRYFEDGLDVISDAVSQPAFDAEEMLREREVILEEIRRAEDSTSKILFRNLWESSFPDSPYGRPVLGFQDTVSKMDAKQLKSYFQKNYNAGTISVVVVGDITSKKAYEKVQQYFGKLKKQPRDNKVIKPITPNPKQASIVTSARDVKECHLYIGIPAVHLHHPLVPALDLACSALGSGESSRLYQTLVKEKRLALDADMGLVATSGCGLITIGVVTSPEHLEKCVLECRVLLEQAAMNGLEPEEIERIKTSFEADIIYGKETVDKFARRIGYYHLHFGDPQYEKKHLYNVLAVEGDAVKAALKKVAAAKPCLSLVHPLNYKPDKKSLKCVLFRQLPKVVYSAPKPALQLEQWKTVRFISKPVDALPAVSVRMVFPGGSREESLENQGLGNLFAQLWTAGTPSYTSKQIAHELESIGAEVSAFCGKNTHGLSVEFLSKHWKRLQPIVEEILVEPTFPEEEFITAQSITLRDIRSQYDAPAAHCIRQFSETLYGNHPYGRYSLGTEPSITQVTREDLKSFFKKYIHRQRLVVSSVGQLDPRDWQKELEPLLSKLPEHGELPKPAISISAHQTPKIKIATKTPLSQSHLLIGFLGATYQDHDAMALRLMASCLQGQGGRLFLELRDKKSLAYSVSAMNSEAPEPGYFAFYIACAPDKVEESLKCIRLEIDKLIHTPIPKAELERAKQYWIGRFELDLQRYGSQAMLFALDETYGLGHDFSEKLPDLVRAITATEVQQAAHRYFRVDAPVMSLVHPEDVPTELLWNAWNP